MVTSKDAITLADWRRSVAEMYAGVRNNPNVEVAWEQFWAARDLLFMDHPQTPLTGEQQARFSGLSYYDYDPDWCLSSEIDTNVKRETFEIMLPAEGAFRYSRVGKVSFVVQGKGHCLSLYWVEGYGGGLFLPFLDATSGKTTYGGGRYLLDTIKGADLGTEGSGLVLDFNFAYNPSCVYNPRWVCPLAPPENRLPFVVPVGEMDFCL